MSSDRSARRPRWHLPVLLLAVLGFGAVLGRGCGGTSPSATDSAHSPEAATVWTCSMHPQIQLPDPGQCPICFMDLIPLANEGAEDRDAPRLVLSEAARTMAEIETAVVVRDRPFVELRLVGKVDFDETRVSAITAWAPGRLDRLFVDYLGVPVRRGDHLAEIYSPELLSAQEELLQAVRMKSGSPGAGSALMQGSADAIVVAAQEKLRLLGLTAQQIERVTRDGSTSDHVTLFAQTGGVVVEKNAVEGDYVNTGTVIYRIADLDHLWVMLDAYESDLVWLRPGQEVEFTTVALPGQAFRGDVAFIAPILDSRTRTSKVRVHVDNRDGRLKPEMFVNATVLAEVGADGHVVTRDLAGKYICPMHPEIVRGVPGACDVCGMDLERAEDLGHSRKAAAGEGPLVVPRTAVLFTGKRAVVYVKDPHAERPTYDGREVVLGPRAGDVYLVQEGLAEGDHVVVQGAFKIDSALQIQARPSMMSPDEKGAPAATSAPVDLGDELAAELSSLYAAYFGLSRALAADDAAAARTAYATTRAALTGVQVNALGTRGRSEWSRLAKELDAALSAPAEGAELEALRVTFEAVSAGIVEIERAFGHAGDAPFYVTFCPMAFDNRGAHWLQDDAQINNPYYGSRMLRCGSVTEELPARGGGR